MSNRMLRFQQLALAAGAGAITWSGGLSAGELPTACFAGTCGVAGSWVSQGTGSLATSGNHMEITQTTPSATFNWSSFNIGSDSSVTFKQPDASSVALNRIFQADASRIFGSLTANGQVYLLNQNGILFGSTAKVNVGGLVASSLNISQAAVDDGIARASQSSQPAFSGFRAVDGTELESGAVQVAKGATIDAARGQVLLFAPEVTNEGTIRTPDGQTILAAGKSVYLATSTDPNLRGLLVEVGTGGTATNGSKTSTGAARPQDLIGQISAERGNVTIAGLAVNQLGRVSATTTVRQNGSIRLQARDGGTALPNQSTGIATLRATSGGTITVGQGSSTQVALDLSSTETTVDTNAQPRSLITMDAGRVNILGKSRIEAKAGSIDITSHQDPQRDPSIGGSQDTSRIFIASDATLDVSGASKELAMERNVLRVELRGSQLQDSPVQRDGPLRSEAVFVDIRKTGTRADGTTWVGTPLADVSGDIATISRDVAERNLAGGTISLRSQGDVIVSDGAMLDVSGGYVDFRSGFVNTTSLVGADGKIYDIANADRERAYLGTSNVFTVKDDRWGVTRTYQPIGSPVAGTFESGYREGKDAGKVSILAPVSILDGAIRGDVQTGRNQRQPSALSIASNALYRAFNELPRGAQLVIGNATPASSTDADFVTRGISVAEGFVLPGLLAEPGKPFDPLAETSLPETLLSTVVRPALFGAGKVSEATLLTNGLLELGAGESLELPGGGRFTANAGQLDIRGRIDAPSGAIALTAQRTVSTLPGEVRFELADTARLSARGSWINEQLDLGAGTTPTAPLLINGGDISLAARQGDLLLATGSVLDTSAGALRDASGRIKAGKAGAISLSASPIEGEIANLTDRSTRFVLGSELRAWSLSQGGKLSVTANSLCVAALDCSGDDASKLWMTPDSLTAGGFESVSLTAARGGLTIVDGTTVDLRQRNIQLLDTATRAATGTDIATISREALLPEYDRRPMTLALTNRISTGGVAVDDVTFRDLPVLSIGRNASIQTDAFGSVSLASSSSIFVDGAIHAPSGKIDLLLDTDLTTTAFMPSQQIWLGSGSTLEAAGYARVRTNDLGQRLGDVFNAGSISLTARRGYIVAGQGSRIDVSGGSATLDIPASGLADPARTSTLIGSAGGSLSLVASEGIVMDATINAHAGETATAVRPAGGSLLVSLDPNRRTDPDTQFNSRFPVTTRAIEFSQTVGAVSLSAGSAIPASFNGLAKVSAQSISSAGFDSLTAVANTLEGVQNGQQLLVPGEIRFKGDVDLRVGQRLAFDAAGISGDGGHVRVSAPYVALGHTDRARQTVPLLLDGRGTLSIEAQLIDLIGASVINGFGSTQLTSTGDIRARGVQPINGRALTGSLMTSGDLILTADQIYPTTLSQFEIAVRGDDERRLEIRGTGGPRADVLSAGGSLTLRAPTILQSGVLRAPIGAINLIAEGTADAPGNLVLAPGSLTSTSADGLTIPFGSTQGGFDWVYELEEGQTLAYEPGSATLPSQQITLDAARVDFQSGATVDVSGGGDLLAYEFLPGPGGSRDVLSGTVRPNQFAVVPGLKASFAPYDPREHRGYDLRPGDSVYLSGADGLPAGEYVLLPARYALLPGAYLVNAVAGYQDIGSSEKYSQIDGSTIVSGYRTFAGSGTGSARSGGFAVRSAAVTRKEALYTTSTANQFFAAQAAADGNTAPITPRDAGAVAIAAAQQLILEGSLRATSGAGARGSRVDFASSRVRIGDATTIAEDGEVVIDAAALNGLGAQSVLVGGKRRMGADGMQIDVTAGSVTVNDGTHVTGPEILLAARDTVLVESGARVSASGAPAGAAADTFELQGDGALLRVAKGAGVDVVRSASTGATGTLDLREGSIIEAPGGAVFLDASGNTSSRAQLDVRGGSLGFGANRVSLGDAPPETAGLLLSPSALGALGLNELRLASGSTIDLYGPVDLTTRNLSLLTPEIRVLGSDDSSARLNATEKLSWSSTATSGTALPETTGSRRLALAARDIELGGGALKVTGAKNTLFSASQEIRFTKNGSLDLAGDTSMQASRISAGAGVDATLRSPGVFSTMLPDAGAVTLAKDAELGARLSVLARAIDHRGNISLPGGALSLHAIGTSGTDSVTLAAGSRLDVSGRVVTFDDASVGAQGGTIELISDFSDVRVAPTAEVAVNAGSSGNAGSILLRALRGNVDVEGSLRGSASSADRGGEITVDAGRIARFGALNAMLEENGFTSARSFRQRGVGGLLLGVGQSLTAHRVSVTADQGALSILGSIDAHGPAGGLVSLNARNTITIAGTVDVSAHATGAAGGRIDLASTSGVYIAPGSLLNLSAGAPTGGTDAPRDGSLNIRLPRTAFSSLVDGTPGDEAITIAGRIEGAPRITLEGYKVYVDANGVLSAAEVEASDDNDMYREAGEFAANAAAIATALGRGDDEKFLVAPGIEIQSTGDLKLSADWNLSQWRFNDAPGVLTLRSGGSLLFDRSLSDGFAEVMGEEGFVLPETAGRSWSYRLAAGADRTSANALAVLDSTLLGTTRGDLKIAAGQVNNLMGGSRMIRTGTGTIDIATANDVVLGNRASVIYTAGAASSGFPLASDFGEIGYPTGGGDISIAANGNILGAQSNQLVTDWLWRTGRTEEQGEDIPVAWTVNFGRFAQGVGALGGGSVSVRAGGDIDNLSVSLPTIGRQVGGNTFAKSAVEVVGGGTLDVYAAGNIRGGSYYVGRGRGLLDAGGSIAPTSAAPNALAPILALGDAQFAVHARNGLALDGIVNPTLLPQGLSQGAASAQTYFATYTPQSSVSLTSTAGDLQFRDTPGAIQSTFTSMNFLGSGNSPLSMRIAAPTLRASSLSGDLQLAGAIGLFPSVSGTLDLLAEQDIRFANSLQITLSDADAAVLPSMANPQEGFGTLSLLVQPGSAAANFHADTPVHMPSKGGTIQPVRLVARTGDIVNEAVATGNSVSLYSAKPVRVSAGRDVRDLSMIVQNLLDSDITSIRAGRDIVYSTVRGTSGAVLETLGNIAIDGPGRLLLEAGRNVDLQASAGIATRGNLTNPALPANGASISVLAGTGASPPAYAAFVDRYLVSPTLYGADLIAFVEQQTGEKLDHARALARFRSFDVPRQRALLERVLLAELRTSGREAARSSSQDFTRAFAALETLYPGSNPDTDAGETNRYTGDIRLYFSRVYTLAGGDIDLLAPGGEINVGLATPPVAFGIQKPASSLGIVAQGTGSVSALAYKDFQVNESRVFAADGGNILVWSTRGDIDAGRGAKTAISAPPPTIIVDPRTGRVTVSRPSALTGSGIQTLATSLGRKPGDVDLFAPRGVVNAGDAGIVAGNLTIAATAVLGANNISVSGTAVGLPVDTGGLGASLAGASSSASGASKAAESDLEGGRGAAKSDTPVADAVLGWLEVFVEGFGADVCKPNDAACLNRENQKTGQ